MQQPEQNIELRDYIAIQVIAGASANGDWKSYTAYKLASKAYEIADAMMEARQK